MITNWQQLYQLLSQPQVQPVLFHGPKGQAIPIPQDQVPPQATPAPEREAPLEYMPPIAPAMPPLPTRKPDPREIDRTQGYMPAGGFGATGDVSGSELERRIRKVEENPFAGRGTDYSRGLWPWQKDYWNELTQNVSDIYNAPKPEGHDEIMAALSLMPAGRLMAPIRMGAKALAERKGLEGLKDVVETGYRRAWQRGAGTPAATKAPTRQPQSLAEELQQIHRSVKRNQAPARRREIPEYSAAEKARVRRATYEQRKKDKIISQLREKGRLDQEWGEVVRSRVLR